MYPVVWRIFNRQAKFVLWTHLLTFIIFHSVTIVSLFQQHVYLVWRCTKDAVFTLISTSVQALMELYFCFRLNTSVLFNAFCFFHVYIYLFISPPSVVNLLSFQSSSQPPPSLRFSLLSVSYRWNRCRRLRKMQCKLSAVSIHFHEDEC